MEQNMDIFAHFAKKQYLNLETFRRNGVGVRTPVWFVQDDDRLYVTTMANSGKVKRIRNNGQVNIAPCKMDGTPLGEWVPAAAREVRDQEAAKKVDRLMDRKYGLMKKVFGLASARQGRENTILELKERE
jgi:PPOX class probable F420-dependent enzyme